MQCEKRAVCITKIIEYTRVRIHTLEQRNHYIPGVYTDRIAYPWLYFLIYNDASSYIPICTCKQQGWRYRLQLTFLF